MPHKQDILYPKLIPRPLSTEYFLLRGMNNFSNAKSHETLDNTWAILLARNRMRGRICNCT